MRSAAAIAGLATLAVCVLAACSNSSMITACSIDSVAGGDTTGMTFVDCGTYTTGSELYTDPAMVSAQACVLNAITRKQGFLLVYDALGEDGQPTPALRGAFTGAVREGQLVLRSYAGQGPASMPMEEDFVSARSCVTLDATDSCKPRIGVPCLECTSLDPGMIVCRGS